MKILLLAPQPFYQDRGTPIAVRLLAQTLGEQGHDVHLLVFHEGEAIMLPNVTIHRNISLPGIANIKPGLSIKKLITDFFLFFKCLHLVTTEKFDLLHAVEESVFMAMIVKKIFKIPYVYDMDSCMSLQLMDKLPALQPLRRLMEWPEKKAVIHSAGVVAVCQSLADTARNCSPDKNIAIIEDITLLDAESSELEDIRHDLNIQGLIIMYVGNLEKYQGIDLLLESFKKATLKENSINLVIIGGAASDICFYQQRAEQLGIATRVFFTGPRPVRSLGGYLRQADILVSPRTQGNNTPMKIYSYLDSGRPVLATRLPTHTQVLDDEIACLVNPTTEEMADGMVILANTPEFRNNLSLYAKLRVKQKYTLPVLKKKIAAFYSTMNEQER